LSVPNVLKTIVYAMSIMSDAPTPTNGGKWELTYCTGRRTLVPICHPVLPPLGGIGASDMIDIAFTSRYLFTLSFSVAANGHYVLHSKKLISYKSKLLLSEKIQICPEVLSRMIIIILGKKVPATSIYSSEIFYF
jgi:hypothetical protein